MRKARTWLVALSVAVFLGATGFTACDPNRAECDRYVRPDGNNAADGQSTGMAWKTLTYAEAHISSGQTVCVGSGTYNERLAISVSGTSGNRTIFRPYAAESPVIDGTGISLPNTRDALVDLGGNWIELNGFTVRDSAGRGVSVSGANNVVTGTTIAHTAYAGLITTNFSRASNNNSYSFNDISNTVSSDPSQDCKTPTDTCSSGGGWESAVNNYTDGGGAHGSNDYVANNIHNNWGEGMTLDDNDVVTNNTVHDNFSVNIYIDSANNAQIDQNLIYESETTDPAGNGQSYRLIAAGVTMSNEHCTPDLSGDKVRNNFILNVRLGINFWNASGLGCSGLNLVNLTVDNNTIANTWDTGLQLDTPNGGAAHSGVIVRDNIVWPRTGQSTTSGVLSTTGVTASYNVLRAGTCTGCDNTNPWGTTPTGHDPNSFKIDTTSSAYNSGTTSSVAVDYFGTSRPQAGVYDVGAHER